jgi:hypothetical protein
LGEQWQDAAEEEEEREYGIFHDAGFKNPQFSKCKLSA